MGNVALNIEAAKQLTLDSLLKNKTGHEELILAAREILDSLSFWFIYRSRCGSESIAFQTGGHLNLQCTVNSSDLIPLYCLT